MPLMLPLSRMPEVLAGLAGFGVLETRAALTEMAQQVERQAKLNANTGHSPPHSAHIPGTGPGPNTQTIKLQRGITHSPVIPITPTKFQSIVGVSSMVPYGETVELEFEYPYLNPALETVSNKAADIFRKHFAAFTAADLLKGL